VLKLMELGIKITEGVLNHKGDRHLPKAAFSLGNRVSQRIVSKSSPENPAAQSYIGYNLVMAYFGTVSF